MSKVTELQKGLEKLDGSIQEKRIFLKKGRETMRKANEDLLSLKRSRKPLVKKLSIELDLEAKAIAKKKKKKVDN